MNMNEYVEFLIAFDRFWRSGDLCTPSQLMDKFNRCVEVGFLNEDGSKGPNFTSVKVN